MTTFCLRWWQVPYYWVGIKAYDLVSGRQLLKSSYILSKGKALELFPMLKKDKLKAALVYYDGKLPSSFSFSMQFVNLQVLVYLIQILEISVNQKGKYIAF